MLHLNADRKPRSFGFTIVELLVSIAVLSLVLITFTIFFKQSLYGYLDLQYNATSLTKLYVKSQRLIRVLRGATKIDTADANNLTAYAYFYPSDQFVSKLHYYIDSSGKTPELKVDLTPMTANPPIGTPITAKQRTMTIMDNFYQPNGVDLFSYLNASGQPIDTPVSQLNSIRAIKVNLAMKTAAGSNYTTSLRVTLRNMGG